MILKEAILAPGWRSVSGPSPPLSAKTLIELEHVTVVEFGVRFVSVGDVSKSRNMIQCEANEISAQLESSLLAQRRNTGHASVALTKD